MSVRVRWPGEVAGGVGARSAKKQKSSPGPYIDVREPKTAIFETGGRFGPGMPNFRIIIGSGRWGIWGDIRTKVLPYG